MKKSILRSRLAESLFAPLYIMVIAAVASLTGVDFVLFPELGALAHDVFTRPRGRWAQAPWMLIATPLLTALAGLICARHLPFGVASVLLCTLASIAIVVVLRSPVTPAISAGLLPLVFDIRSWWYPPAILFGSVLLALLSLLQRRWQARQGGNPPGKGAPGVAGETLKGGHSYLWVPFFLVFLLTATLLAVQTGWRAILAPPLVVMGFELFAHADHCPWVERPLILPLASVLSAVGGVALAALPGPGSLAAGCAVGLAVLVLRVVDMHIPPVVAIGLIPLLIDAGGVRYPLAVALGTGVLALSFLAYRALAGRHLPRHRSEPAALAETLPRETEQSLTD